MKYLKQFTLLCLISLTGEALNHLIPLPVPASIWGMLLLFVLLVTRVVKLSQVEDTADFLFAIMPLTFIPLGAQLLVGYQEIQNDILSILAICVISTFVVYLVTALLVQAARRHGKGDASHE
ncbi:MAG: CidA/LrgA family protein [Eubacteriales bacterium]|jgi:holin-like protein